jgi:hypothetical protein
MAAIRPSRFARLGNLHRMKGSTFHAFFDRYSHYLTTRGVVLPATLEDYDFEPLSFVMSSPDLTTPADFVEELELLDLITGPQSVFHFERDYAEVVERVREEDDSVVDLAVKILRAAPEIAWREFDRRALQCERFFAAFVVPPEFPMLDFSTARQAGIESTLGTWFERNARTSWCRVRAQSDEHGMSFIVRHGEMLNRLGVIEDGSSAQRILRPERLDIVHFRSATRHWFISGVGSRLVEEYRQAFGVTLHGSSAALVPAHRFSLDPLKRGPSCLDCPPTGQINYAQLKSVKVEAADGQCSDVSKGDMFGFIRGALRTGARLIEARIALKVSGRRRQVVVRINLDRDSLTGAVDIPAVEHWLENARFVIRHDTGELLASA